MADSLDDRETHEPAGQVALDRALGRVPRVSGDLADTIALEVRQDGSELIAGSPAVPYAGVIEYGWGAHGIEAQHYLAGDDVPAAVHDAYAEKVGELVERVGRES